MHLYSFWKPHLSFGLKHMWYGVCWTLRLLIESEASDGLYKPLALFPWTVKLRFITCGACHARQPCELQKGLLEEWFLGWMETTGKSCTSRSSAVYTNSTRNALQHAWTKNGKEDEQRQDHAPFSGWNVFLALGCWSLLIQSPWQKYLHLSSRRYVWVFCFVAQIMKVQAPSLKVSLGPRSFDQHQTKTLKSLESSPLLAMPTLMIRVICWLLLTCSDCLANPLVCFLMRRGVCPLTSVISVDLSCSTCVRYFNIS